MNLDEKECRILATALHSSEAVNGMLDKLKSIDFSSIEAQGVYGAIKSLSELGSAVNLRTVVDYIQQYKIGVSEEYLVTIGLLPRAFDLDRLMDEILEESTLRQMASAVAYVQDEILRREKNSTELKDRLYKCMGELDRSPEKTYYGIGELIEGHHKDPAMPMVEDLINRRKKAINGDIHLEGVTTGYHELDHTLSGFAKGHLVLVGARPGVGKSTFMLNCIKRMCWAGAKVGCFSLEMTADEVMQKLLSMESTLGLTDIRQGTLSEYAVLGTIPSTLKRMEETYAGFYLDDQPGLTAEQIRARAKRMIDAHGVQAIFIDHCSEMGTTQDKQPRKDLQIRHSAQVLRDFAKSAGIPVILVCQLNRDSAKTSKTPDLHDLRESGALEELAAEVILLHRPDAEEPQEKPGLLMCIIAKNRFGPKWTYHYSVDRKTGDMLIIDPKAKEPEPQEVPDEFARFTP